MIRLIAGKLRVDLSIGAASCRMSIGSEGIQVNHRQPIGDLDTAFFFAPRSFRTCFSGGNSPASYF